LIYVVSTALLVLAPQTLSLFIDSVQNSNLLHASVLAVLLYLSAMLAQAAMAAVLDYRLARIGLYFTDECRRDLMSHYLSLDAQSLAGLGSGEMLTRLNDDAQGLFNYYYILFYKLTGSALALAGILVVLFLKVSWLSAVLLLVSLLAVLGFKVIQDKGIPKYVRRAAAAASFNSLLRELLDNSPVLRGLGAETQAGIKMHAAMKTRYRESFPANLMYANLWSASTVVEILLTGTGLLLALLLWDRGSISIGTAYMIYSYCTLVSSPLQDFRNHMGNMQGAKAGIIRTMEFFGRPSGIHKGDSLLAVNSEFTSSTALDLAIEDLQFSYGNSAPVLRGLNLAAAAGSRIGIMGETGSGKSTLLALIAGLNNYEHGSIRLGGIDLHSVSSADLRQKIAYCTQKVQLIHGSIRDNIAFYDESYTDTDILKAIDLLDLTDWFAKFRDGLDSRLEMGEGNLSSGEAQLLTLVRLSLRNPALVLLDEISSSLDPIAEKRLIAAVKKLCKGRTVVAIAHRKETLYWMDEILYMENGVLCRSERGTENAY